METRWRRDEHTPAFNDRISLRANGPRDISTRLDRAAAVSQRSSIPLVGNVIYVCRGRAESAGAGRSRPFLSEATPSPAVNAVGTPLHPVKK